LINSLLTARSAIQGTPSLGDCLGLNWLPVSGRTVVV
jgi:hypothetical protein